MKFFLITLSYKKVMAYCSKSMGPIEKPSGASLT